MSFIEVLILCIYLYIVLHICFYNHKVIQHVQTIKDKKELHTILNKENQSITFFTFSSIGSLFLFYFYFNFHAYLVLVILILILQFSFSSMKKNILKQINYNDFNLQ